MKRRLLRIALIALAVVAFTGYFAFSTFLFSPFEDDYPVDVSTLIPRDVDFFVAKADLAGDFQPFPVPAFVDGLGATEGGSTFLADPDWQSSPARQTLLDIRAAVDEALAPLERLPLSVEPLEVLGGRDVALAGYFRGADLAQADFAVYARGNWMAKLGIALFQYPGLMDLESQGIAATADGDVVSLSGGGLPRPLHVTRLNDVVVIATDASFATSAHELASRFGEDSFGGSARYYDHIQQREREPNDLEVFVDYRKLSEARQFTGRWPDQASQDFFPALMGRLFQSGTLNELVGVAGFGSGVSLDLHGVFSSEAVSSFQKQLYRMRGSDRGNVYDVARFAPADAGLFAFFHAGFGPLLRQILDSVEPALRDNLDDLAREVWAYPDVGPLIEDLDAAFHDRAAFVLGANDYPVLPDDPPNDGSPVPAWALILWVDDVAEVEGVRKKVIDNQGRFGIDGPDGRGVWVNEISGGQVVHEFWSLLIPGTGHIATVRDQGVFIISNSYSMLDEILKTRYEGAPRFPRLAEQPRFEALLESALPHTNVVLWANPSGLSSTLRALAQRRAEDEVVVNWSVQRPAIDRKVLNERFPDWNYETLTQSQKDQLEVFAAQERNKYERELREQQVPALRARYERRIVYLEQIPAALLEIALSPKDFELSARVLLSLDPAGGS